MKTIALAIATTILAFTATAQSKMNIGDNLPNDQKHRNASTGKEMSFSDAMGKNGLLVMFSCNTCPFVIRNQEVTKKTMEYARAHNVGMVIINSNEAKRAQDDSYDAMKKYAKDQGYDMPYLVDEGSKLADEFGANHTPEIFLFDKKGRLVYKGAMNDNPGDPQGAKVMYINNAIDAVVAGKEVDPNITKSVGCSIKRKA